MEIIFVSVLFDRQEAMNENGFFEKLVSYTEVAPFLVGFAHVIHQRIGSFHFFDFYILLA